MSLARVTAFALDGVDSRRVWVEADIRVGLPAFTIVGLADKAIREARERVRSAITNSGFEFPQKRITINLAPAYLRKIGPGFDLPLAMAILAASGQVEREQVEGCVFAGELSLTGEVRQIRRFPAAEKDCWRAAHRVTELRRAEILARAERDEQHALGGDAGQAAQQQRRAGFFLEVVERLAQRAARGLVDAFCRRRELFAGVHTGHDAARLRRLGRERRYAKFHSESIA